MSSTPRQEAAFVPLVGPAGADAAPGKLLIHSARWLGAYQKAWLVPDLTAGLTLAAYAVPISLAYATLAGLPPQVGIYGYLLGGIGYAFFGSCRQLAIGPTSAISLMIAATIEPMAAGDALRFAQIASLTAFTVAALAVAAWALHLSTLVQLISNSVLTGFKIGAGLTIAITQIPSLLGIPGGGHDFFERVTAIASQVPQTNPTVALLGVMAIVLIIAGTHLAPGRPVALAVVVLAIVAATLLHLPALGVPVTGQIPSGLPHLQGPALRIRDVEGILPLAAGCLLLAYIESISAARTMADKHGYSVDARQELLGLGAANLLTALGQGYPVAGGLSQSAVNDSAGARSPLALLATSATLALCLLFLTGLLENLPRAVLAAVVLTAILGLFDLRAMRHMWRVSRIDFYVASTALIAALVLGILPGILVAALASILLMLARASRPHVAFLGRIPGTTSYSDSTRHPDNESVPGVLAFRPEASLTYINVEYVLSQVMHRLGQPGPALTRAVICDLSACPHIDMAGARMLAEFNADLEERGCLLRIVGAHGRVRDLLRADGLEAKIGRLDRRATLGDVLRTLPL